MLHFHVFLFFLFSSFGCTVIVDRVTFSDVDAAAPEAGDANDFGFGALHWTHGSRGGCLRPEPTKEQ